MKQTLRKLVLASSIALALGGIGSAFASDPKPHETTTEQLSDARHESQILTSFSTNRHLRGFDLAVTVDGNKAVLSGNVDENVSKELAEQIALGVDGIKRVDNRIAVDANYLRPKHEGSERSFGDKVEDATITASVKSKLLWNTHTDGLDIHVDTNNSKVTLTGNAGSSKEKVLAGRIARDTEGVVAVNNNIALNGKPDNSEKMHAKGEKAEQKVSDSWITTKVKSSLATTRGVNAFEITVTTTNGVVSLNGLVDTPAERDRAIQVAQDIRGVNKVDSSGIKFE
jgi:osmotically-inducible protein OsmY